jgi:hypothetical protein
MGAYSYMTKGREGSIAAWQDRAWAAEKRIAELKAELQRWLEWADAQGPGLEAYREQGRRIAELEGERDRFKRQWECRLADYRAAIDGAINLLRNDLYKTRVSNALAVLEDALEGEQ